MTSFNEFIRSIQTDGNDGQAFEHFCKWFLLNDPYWKTQVDKAWLWDEWPERWGPDCGIDLIFKHKSGETWAVQAKCYDEKYSVSKADMDTLDMSRFDAAPLIAFIAAKETDYGNETDGRIPG
mgnify:FL=1